MKVKMLLPQIRARQITFPRLNADEIYVAYTVALGSPGLAGAPTEVKLLGGRVSSIKENVSKGCPPWTPNEDGMPAEFDIPDGKMAVIRLALFERDDGNIYDELKRAVGSSIDPEKFPWQDIKDIYEKWKAEDLPTDKVELAIYIIKAVWKLTKHFLQDDLLDQKEIVIAPSTKEADLGDDWTGTRELEFVRLGADYRLSVNLSKVE